MKASDNNGWELFGKKVKEHQVDVPKDSWADFQKAADKTSMGGPAFGFTKTFLLSLLVLTVISSIYFIWEQNQKNITNTEKLEAVPNPIVGNEIQVFLDKKTANSQERDRVALLQKGSKFYKSDIADDNFDYNAVNEVHAEKSLEESIKSKIQDREEKTSFSTDYDAKHKNIIIDDLSGFSKKKLLLQPRAQEQIIDKDHDAISNKISKISKKNHELFYNRGLKDHLAEQENKSISLAENRELRPRPVLSASHLESKNFIVSTHSSLKIAFNDYTTSERVVIDEKTKLHFSYGPVLSGGARFGNSQGAVLAPGAFWNVTVGKLSFDVKILFQQLNNYSDHFEISGSYEDSGTQTIYESSDRHTLSSLNLINVPLSIKYNFSKRSNISLGISINSIRSFSSDITTVNSQILPKPSFGYEPEIINQGYRKYPIDYSSSQLIPYLFVQNSAGFNFGFEYQIVPRLHSYVQGELAFRDSNLTEELVSINPQGFNNRINHFTLGFKYDINPTIYRIIEQYKIRRPVRRNR